MDMTGARSDDQLALSIRSGDEQGFGILMHRYFPIMTLFAIRLVRDRAEAEDIVENVFIRLWETRDRIEGFESLKAFLYISVRNSCLNALRGSDRQGAREAAFAANLGSHFDSQAVEREIVRSEVLAEIIKTAEDLPEKIGVVFRLSFLEGLTNREIARRLGVSGNTVKAQKARAVELLKEKLRHRDMLTAAAALVAVWDWIN